MSTTNFPTALDTISSLPNPGSGDFTTAPSHASQHDVENDALRAIEAKVGIGASTPTANTVLRATGTGTTAYAQVGLTTDVTGTLPVTNGGTGITTLGSGIATFLGTPSSANLATAVTDETGTGVLVFNSSPTIVTPTIASFTNAQHNHSNATGGGTLSGNTAIQAGTIPFANLLSTIFSGQVQTQANAGSAGGTMYYINLGGIKILWGFTGTLALTGSSQRAYDITYPTSFFSTVQTCVITPTGGTAGSNQFVAISGNGATTTTTVSFYYTATDGNTNGTQSQASMIVIGT
jgi:hypothetical protein